MKRNTSKNKIDFSTPENYFSDFDKRLERKIEISESIPKAAGFKVPQGYFDALSPQVWNNVNKSEPSPKSGKLRVLYVASSIAAILILGFILVKPGHSYATDETRELTELDINSYIDEGFMSLSTYDIIETFEGVSLEDIRMAEPIPKAEIIEYLNKNNIDNYTLTVEEN